DLVARAIHAGSPRGEAMFLPYNCTSATRELADSQLFGHRRGSFTGAVADQPGVIRSAAGGTIFLDEIGDLPIDVQPKLLRFLEQGEILPVGETRPSGVDVRVIAATNRRSNITLGAAVERLEREMIESALQRTAGNISQTARALGLTRRGLYLKMDRLGIAAAAR